MTTLLLTVQCVACKNREKIDPERVTDVPMCSKCFSPMVVVKAAR